MKKTGIIFLSMLLMLSLPVRSFSFVRDIQDNHQITYNIIDGSGDPVGSETVKLKIKRTSDGYWFDFNDSSFKNSGWTSKSTNLSEDATEGYYYYTFDPPASETGADQYLFCVDNASATYGDHQCDVVSYQDIGTSTVTTAQVNAEADTALTDYDGVVPGDLPSNFGDLAITVSTGQVTVGTNADKTGYSISGTKNTLDDLSDITAANVWASGARTLTALDEDNTTIDLDGSTVGTVSNVSDKSGYSLSQAGLADFFDTDSGTTYGSAVSGSVVQEIADNAGGSGLTAAAIADQVWDEAISGHLGAGSTGAALNAAGSAGDPWSTSYPGAYADGTFGGAVIGIQDATDGDKESGSYTGIENTIRRNR